MEQAARWDIPQTTRHIKAARETPAQVWSHGDARYVSRVCFEYLDDLCQPGVKQPHDQVVTAYECEASVIGKGHGHEQGVAENEPLFFLARVSIPDADRVRIRREKQRPISVGLQPTDVGLMSTECRDFTSPLQIPEANHRSVRRSHTASARYEGYRVHRFRGFKQAQLTPRVDIPKPDGPVSTAGQDVLPVPRKSHLVHCADVSKKTPPLFVQHRNRGFCSDVRLIHFCHLQRSAFFPGISYLASPLPSSLHPTTFVRVAFSMLSIRSDSGNPPSVQVWALPATGRAEAALFPSNCTDTSQSLPPCGPVYFSSAAASYPAGTGSAQIRRSMAPNSGRVRWLSARSSQ